MDACITRGARAELGVPKLAVVCESLPNCAPAHLVVLPGKVVKPAGHPPPAKASAVVVLIPKAMDPLMSRKFARLNKL